MGGTVEDGGFIADLVMAGRTVRAIGAGNELTFVWILVAIRATVVRNPPVKIPLLMAAATGKLRMLAYQLELRSGVIETTARAVGSPSARVMACLAGACKSNIMESATVRVVVTTLAATIIQAFEQGGGFAGPSLH